MERSRRYSHNEKRILVVSLLMAFLFSSLLFDDSWLRRILFDDALFAGSAGFAHVSGISNDVRFKNGRSPVWDSADHEMSLTLGDSVFTGEDSKARIDFKNGGQIDLEPNSLIVFRDEQGARLAEIMQGSFVILVNGPMKLRIGDEVITVDGRNSKIRISKEKDGRARLENLAGLTKVRSKSGEANLGPQGEIALRSKKFSEPPRPAAPHAEVDHVWTLHEYYHQNEGRWSPRQGAREIRHPFRLVWMDDPLFEYRVEVAAAESFQAPRSFSVKDHQIGIETWTEGTHFWRVKREDSGWSKTAKVEVRGRFLEDAPQVDAGRKSLPFLKDPVRFDFQWKAPAESSGFVVEHSPRADFPPEQVEVIYSREASSSWTFPRPGLHYFRVRSLNARMQLSLPSEVMEFDIAEPARLPPPRLANEDWNFDPYQVRLHWESPAGAASSIVEVYDSRGKQIERREVQGREWNFPLAIGHYSARVTAVDIWGRRGEPSEIQNFQVREKALSAPLAANETERKPSADELSTLHTQIPVPDHLNRFYSSPWLQIEGASFGMFSTEQQRQETELPLATLISLRVKHWWKDFGLETSLKTKVFNLSDSARDVNPTSLEARGHVRSLVPWRTFSFLRELQISAFAGIEAYQNPGSRDFSKGYTLAKVGFALDIPLASAWQTGGEALYGIAKQTEKYEISGFFSYYLKKAWSVGLGYRLHFFNTQDRSVMPASTPEGDAYREAYGEGFSLLQYHY